MALSYHVDGPVLVKTGTGVANALESLGISEDGVNIEINEDIVPLKTDAAGSGNVPAELQRMNADANISMVLMAYDSALLARIRRGVLAAGAIADGTMLSPGLLIGTNSNCYRIVLSSADEPWRFYTAVLRGAQRVKVGTKAKGWALNFYAWPFVPAATTTVSGILLYDHTDG